MTYRLLAGPVESDAALDLAIGPALLANLVSEPDDPWLRVYRPQPTVAFTARDRLLPGFGVAVEAARAQGFTPVRRSSGGRAAAYTGQAICLDVVGRETTELADINGRFERFGTLLTDALVGMGVDARLGEIPGEYCPGEFSVSGGSAGGGSAGGGIAGGGPEGVGRVTDGSRIKLIGTAQRMTRRCWLFGVVIVVSDGPAVRDVLTGVYSALDVPWNPETAGGISDLDPNITLDAVESAVLDAFRVRDELTHTDWPAAVLDDARRRAPDHLL